MGEMVGILDVGGGLRGVFGSGVMDYCLDQGIKFPYCIGVSAGSANFASYLANQRGRNYVYYTQYALRKEYMGVGNFLRRGSYIDLDYVYSTLANSDGENPLDYEAMCSSQSQLVVVSTNAETGEPVYFDKTAFQPDRYDILKASSCLPIVCRPYKIGDEMYYDGGISDPVPVDKALADGCDKVVVILTRPEDFVRLGTKDAKFSRLIRRRYPMVAQRLTDRYKAYNDGVAHAKELRAQGKVLIIAPDDCCGVDTLTKDVSNLDRLYRKGYEAAQKICGFI